MPSPALQRTSNGESLHNHGSKPCDFLDKLPTELRIMVYERLVVSPDPLRGRAARGAKEYGLDLAILRVSHGVYEEALAVFLGRNRFWISSAPGSESREGEKEGNEEKEDQEVEDKQAAESPNNEDQELSTPEATPLFDPPLPPSTWPRLRHLTLDLIYYTPSPSPPSTWRPFSPSCGQYISTLTSLLQTTNPTLQSLSLTSTLTASFCARKALTSFFMLDRNASFTQALAALAPRIRDLDISFEFPDCYFRTRVACDVFLRKSVLLLACQVLFCQSQMRIDDMLRAFERGSGEVEGPGRGEDAGAGGAMQGGKGGEEDGKDRTDLRPYVGEEWEGRLGGRSEGRGKVGERVERVLEEA